MSKQLFNNPNGHRGSTTVSLPMHELYGIMKQRFDMLAMAIKNGNSFDPDALCQSICVEIEKQQGTFPNLENCVSKPIAIWDTETANLWRSCSQEIRDAWDAYANDEAQKDMDSYMRDGSAKNPMTLAKWVPPLTFQAWAEKNNIKISKRQIREVND